MAFAWVTKEVYLLSADVKDYFRTPWHRSSYVFFDFNVLAKTRRNHNCVRGTRTQPLICVRCSVHYRASCAINNGGFFEIAFVVVGDTHLLRFEALAYVLPHFDALTLVVIRVSSAFIFQTFAEVCYSAFVNRSSFKSVLNLRKAYVFCWRSTIHLCLMNVPKRLSFKSRLKVCTLSKILLWIKVTRRSYFVRVHPTLTFSDISTFTLIVSLTYSMDNI